MIRNDLSVALVCNSIFGKKEHALCSMLADRSSIGVDERARQLAGRMPNDIRTDVCIGSELINNNEDEIKSLVKKLNTLV